MANKTTKKTSEDVNARIDMLEEGQKTITSSINDILAHLKGDKTTEDKKTVKKATKKPTTKKAESNTQSLEGILGLMKVRDVPNDKKGFESDYCTISPKYALSKRVDFGTQITHNDKGDTEKIFVKSMSFWNGNAKTDKVTLTNDEAVNLVGLLLDEIPQLREAVKAL